LRDRNLGYKFRRQLPVGRFIVDFYCAKAKLCIEIADSTHLESAQMEYDSARKAWLEEVGCQVIRFTNDDVRYHIKAVVDNIIQTINTILVPSS
jgi:very-short-patch-repair endonuclease